MSLHFFSIPALHPAQEQENLNQYCANHAVVAVEHHLVQAGNASFWAVAVTLREGQHVARMQHRGIRGFSRSHAPAPCSSRRLSTTVHDAGASGLHSHAGAWERAGCATRGAP